LNRTFLILPLIVGPIQVQYVPWKRRTASSFPINDPERALFAPSVLAWFPGELHSKPPSASQRCSSPSAQRLTAIKRGRFDSTGKEKQILFHGKVRAHLICRLRGDPLALPFFVKILVRSELTHVFESAIFFSPLRMISIVMRLMAHYISYRAGPKMSAKSF
jgi:hypothetical protein